MTITEKIDGTNACVIGRVLWHLARDGSAAATKAGVSGTAAEGIVVFHEAARQSFKVTLEGDEKPKGQA